MVGAALPRPCRRFGTTAGGSRQRIETGRERVLIELFPESFQLVQHRLGIFRGITQGQIPSKPHCPLCQRVIPAGILRVEKTLCTAAREDCTLKRQQTRELLRSHAVDCDELQDLVGGGHGETVSRFALLMTRRQRCRDIRNCRIWRG